MNLQFSKIAYVLMAGSLLLLGACGADRAPTSTSAASSLSPTSLASGDGELDWYANLEGRSLNVAGWGGALSEAFDEHFYTPFAEEYGVEFNFVISGTDPTNVVMLQAEQGDIQIDLLEGSTVARLENAGYLEHFPAELRTHLEAHSREGTVTDYSVELGNTATLIVCNPELVDKCPTNAEEFWNVEEFPGERAMAASYNAVLPFAALAGGVSREDVFPIDVDLAIDKLNEIKPHIKVWPDSGAMQEQVLVDREVGIAFMWNGRAHVVKRDHLPNLELHWDDSLVSEGGYVVPKGSPNTDVAFAFLHWFAQQPEAQAEWVEDMTYPMPHQDVMELLPDDIANALPAAHDPVKIDGFAIVEQDEELQAAWQAFISAAG